MLIRQKWLASGAPHGALGVRHTFQEPHSQSSAWRKNSFFFFVDFFDSYDGFRRRGGIVSSLTLASNTHKFYFLLSYYRSSSWSFKCCFIENFILETIVSASFLSRIVAVVSLSDLNRDLNLIHSEYLMKKKIDATTTQIFQAGIGCRSRKFFFNSRNIKEGTKYRLHGF